MRPHLLEYLTIQMLIQFGLSASAPTHQFVPFNIQLHLLNENDAGRNTLLIQCRFKDRLNRF